MSINPGEYVINDSTPWDELLDPIVDGERKGRGAVPRDYRLYPEEMFDPPSNLQIIPKSEWSARIKEQEEKKSRLSDIRGDIPSYDQNGQGYSFREGTEFLTAEKGWVKVEDWNKTDLLATVNPQTHEMEFQAAVAAHSYEYNGEMYHSTNRRLKFGVTDNHQMLVRKWDESRRCLSNEYTMQRADSLGWYVGMMPAPKGWLGTEMVNLAVPGGREYDGDDFAAMVSLIVSDGFVSGSDGDKHLVSFCCFNHKRYNTVKALAARIGFMEQSSRPGVFNARDPELAEWTRRHCYDSPRLGALAKRVPRIIKEMSTRQIHHFLAWYGDQTHAATTPQFYSVNKRLIDDLQELHLRIGKRSHIGKCPPRQSVIKSGHNEGHIINAKELYVLTVGSEDRLCIDRKKHIETDRYKGRVFCASVPNGSLVTRYDDSVLISHNCWFYSNTAVVTVVRAINNQPYLRFSAHAGACKIKGFRDEGGWCGLSAKFWKEQGCPTVDFWAEKSMSRQYDTAETWANAALHKVTEDWVDLTRNIYDQNLTFEQVATCLLSGIPCAVDFNWWGHSVCALDLVEVEPGSFGIRIWNSWGDGWGTKGTSVLQGRKAIPDGAVALRVTGATPI